jgi:hypothetical protein
VILLGKIKIGDVFEIETSKGLAYLQYVHQGSSALIRILPGLYQGVPENLGEIVQNKELFFLKFPIKAALKQKIVKFILNYELPSDLKLPTHMRIKYSTNNEQFWYIVDYSTMKREILYELNDEQKKLSPWGTWNDTLLKEKLAEGWTLEQWV